MDDTSIGSHNLRRTVRSELNLEEIEVSLTLGECRRCRWYSVVRYTIVNRSHRIFFLKGIGLVVKKKHEPVCMSEWGEWSWGGCWCEWYSDVRYTIVNRSRRIFRKGKGLVPKKNHEPVCLREWESHGVNRGVWWCECYYNVRCTILNSSWRICLHCWFLGGTQVTWDIWDLLSKGPWGKQNGS